MGTCGATCGITRERARQREDARQLALRCLAEGPSGASVDANGSQGREEAEALARRLEAVLPCQAHVVLDDAELGPGAAWVYLTASVAGPTWVGFRAGEGPSPASGTEETAVRVGLCPYGRYATLQEVRLRGSAEGEGMFVEESRVVGVVDRRLQLFVKAIQGLLRSLRVVTLDAAFLVEPLSDDAEVTPWAALFDIDPMGTTVASYLPASPAA